MISIRIIKIFFAAFLFSGFHLYSMECEKGGVVRSILSDDELKEIIDRLAASELSSAQVSKIKEALNQKFKRKREENEFPKTPEKRKPLPSSENLSSINFYLSPIKPKINGGVGYMIRRYAVYAWMAIHNDGEDLVIPQEKRIDFSKLLKGKIDHQNIDKALLEIEIRVRGWIKENPTRFFRTIYIGLAENMSKRGQGHRNDLKALEELSPKHLLSSRKIIFARYLQHSGFDIRMSSLVYNIPKEFLPYVEVLLGYLFGANFKGNTLLGDKSAWKAVGRYFELDERKSALQGQELDSVVEDLEKKMFEGVLGFF